MHLQYIDDSRVRYGLRNNNCRKYFVLALPLHPFRAKKTVNIRNIKEIYYGNHLLASIMRWHGLGPHLGTYVRHENC